MTLWKGTGALLHHLENLSEEELWDLALSAGHPQATTVGLVDQDPAGALLARANGRVVGRWAFLMGSCLIGKGNLI